MRRRFAALGAALAVYAGGVAYAESSTPATVIGGSLVAAGTSALAIGLGLVLIDNVQAAVDLPPWLGAVASFYLEDGSMVSTPLQMRAGVEVDSWVHVIWAAGAAALVTGIVTLICDVVRRRCERRQGRCRFTN